jgi:hypothetical protein
MKPRLVAALSVAALAGGLCAAVAVRRAGADGIPTTHPLFYSGVLYDKGAPVTGSRSVGVGLWDAPDAGQVLCVQGPAPVMVSNGVFRVELGPQCLEQVHSHGDVYVDVAIDGMSLGRRPLGAVPYAVEADRASGAAGMLAQRLTALEARAPHLACTNRLGPESRGNLYRDGSVATCQDGEVVTGGACQVRAGVGATASHLVPNGYNCILTSTGGSATETVIAEAVCCRLAP